MTYVSTNRPTNQRLRHLSKSCRLFMGFAATKVTVSLELQFCESAFSKCYN